MRTHATLEDKRVEKTIETIIKRDTPEREVFFDREVVVNESKEVKEMICRVFVQNPKDPFPLVLKRMKLLRGSDYSEFLEKVRTELTGEESREPNNLFWVDWGYKLKADGNEKTHKSSHFWGSGVKEVIQKIEDSIPPGYTYSIERIERISPS